MSEMKSLTLNDKKYDGFVDPVARELATSSGVIISASGESISISNSNGGKLFGPNIYGKTTQDGTPTPDSTVDLVSTGASGAIKTTVCGANLLPGLTEGKTYTRNNLTLKVYADRCVCSGTPNLSYAQVYIASLKDTLKKGVYRVVGGQNGDGTVYVQVIVERGGKIEYHLGDKTFQIYGDEDDVRVSIQTGASTVAVTDYIFYPIVHAGSTPIPYEPYKGQTIAVSTPGGLPGIPVTSGGNYTDANGQQWICDEIDYTSSVRVQRIGVIDSYAGEEISGAFMSTTGAMTAGATIQYILDVPIVTTLSEEDIAAYKALHTYRGHTTVSNDAGAYMEIEYAMDTKKYIDSMIAGAVIDATVE